MTNDSDSDRIRDPFYLPNFCSSAAVFGTVLIAVLVAILMTLARVSRWQHLSSDLAKTSLMMVWTALAVAAVLCLRRRWIARYPVATASLLTFVAVILAVAAMSELIYWLGSVYNPPSVAGVEIWFPQNRWYFLSRNVLVGVIITGRGLL